MILSIAKKILNKNYFVILLLFLIGILSRMPFVEQIQSHWDGPQYSIAIIKYSLQQETPAPPGYPLYIGMGKLIHFLVGGDPHQSLIILSVLFSGIGAAVFYIAGKILFNKPTGVIASGIFLSGSTFYYFGLTPYAYGITPITTTILGLIVYLIIFKSKKIGFFLGTFFSIIIGIRPQEFLLITPLFLLGFYYLPFRQKIIASLSFIIFFLIWFIPFITIVVGGFNKYIDISYEFGRYSFPPFSIERLLKHAELIFKGYWLSFGIAGFFPIYFFIKAIDYLDKNNSYLKKINLKIIFFSTWLIPAFIFNLFIRTEHAGYQMNYLSGLLLLTSFVIWKIFRDNKIYLVLIVTLIISINLLVFFVDRDPEFIKPYRPTSFHFSDIRKNDIKVGTKISFIKKNFSPKTTLVIATPTLWRPIMYYLKDYLIYEFDGLVTNDPKLMYIRRDSKNWEYNFYLDKELKFTVPKNINTIILFDDESINWFLNKNGMSYELGYSSKIYAISCKPGDKFVYGLGFFNTTH